MSPEKHKVLGRNISAQLCLETHTGGSRADGQFRPQATAALLIAQQVLSRDCANNNSRREHVPRQLHTHVDERGRERASTAAAYLQQGIQPAKARLSVDGET